MKFTKDITDSTLVSVRRSTYTKMFQTRPGGGGFTAGVWIYEGTRSVLLTDFIYLDPEELMILGVIDDIHENIIDG